MKIELRERKVMSKFNIQRWYRPLERIEKVGKILGESTIKFEETIVFKKRVLLIQKGSERLGKKTKEWPLIAMSWKSLVPFAKLVSHKLLGVMHFRLFC